jgi:chorismate mutase
MKHSNIIYDATINRTLIDNSLIKALETRKNRLKYNKDIKEIKKDNKKDNKKEKQTTFEMSESHESKPFFKEYK